MADAVVDGAASAAAGEDLVERAAALAAGILTTNAAAVDRDTAPLRQNLAALARAGLAGLAVPAALGGRGARRSIEMRVLEALARGDGTTPFVIAQHYGTTHMLTNSPNRELRNAALPPMATGELLAGFGISHVRRQGKPVLAAAPYGEGFRFDGAIPWMAGHGIVDFVVIAGTLPDERTVLAWVPFAATDCLSFSAPMDLIAMNAARTVSATIIGLVVGPSDIVSVGPNPLRGRPNAQSVPCLFGLAQACIDDLTALSRRGGATTAASAATRLDARLRSQRPLFYELMDVADGAETASTLATARADALGLALDACAALIVAIGGSANALTNPAQRRLREAAILATWGLSREAADVAMAVLA